MSVLITGGAGFIGSHLAERLLDLGQAVAVVDDLSAGRLENLPQKARFYRADIAEPELEAVFQAEKPGAVFHLAAQTSVRQSLRHPRRDARVNVQGTINVFELARRHGVKQIIFASSGGVLYGEAEKRPTPERAPLRPLSPYGVSKLAGEAYLAYLAVAHRLAAVSLRYANVYGERQNLAGEAGVVIKFISRLLSDRPVRINGDGRQTRDFVYVGDVAEATIAAWRRGLRGEFNVGTGREISVNDLFQKLTRLCRSKSAPLFGPALSGEVRKSSLDFSKLEKAAGWRPRTKLEDGLKRTIEWLEKEKKS